MKNKQLIFVHSGWGAKIKDTELGPMAYKSFLASQNSILLNNAVDIYPSKQSILTPSAIGKETFPFVCEVAEKLASVTKESLSKGNFPIIIGGDHSIASGSWAGVIKHQEAAENFGLIWVDAHMDAHTFEDSPSKAYHGMPEAVLLGYGDKELVKIKNFAPKIKPENLVVIGARSYEADEEKFLHSLGVKIFYNQELKERGVQACFLEAIATVTNNRKGFGLSIDLDVFDPAFAPGVGSPEANGLYPTEVLLMLRKLKSSEQLKALEIVEYNPKRDIDNRTLHLLHAIVESFI